MLDDFSAFTVRYEGIGFFPGSGVIFAQPSENPYLSAIHRGIAERYGQDLDQWTRGEDWFPHTTLITVPPADPDAACRAMRKLFVPFEARIGRVEFSLVRETGFTVLGGMELK
ncbi:MAG: 2'-5' RNA ligase family protein [Clostridia bacterium]|nr:2'-5' RNA ligase family protein [Clostridia bacterium]